jgi:hypothetical protein
MSSRAAHLDEFPFGQVAAWLSHGEIVPFLGTGASRSSNDIANMPDGRALADELTGLMSGAIPPGAQDNLAKVAQFFENAVFDRPALYEYLHKRLEVQQAHTQPGAAARMLAKISTGSLPFFLITTNYDSFIERAFRDAGRPLCVITQNMRDPENGASKVNLIRPDGTTGQEDSFEFQWNDSRYPLGTAFLFKMHGSVHRAEPDGPDDVIITEDDYVDFMVSSGGNISPYFPPSSLTNAYKRRRFLFLGYSLYDWNFRAFLRMLVLRNALSGREMRRHYAIQLNPDAIEVQLWKQRNVNLYDGDIAEFCDRTMKSLADRS